MNDTRHKKGLTLVELLVAMLVTSIVMTAVATLAFAVSSANKAADDTSEKQAQIRFTTLKISELIRHSKLICYVDVAGGDLVVWRADDTDGGDNSISVGELVYIETSDNRIRLMNFIDIPIWLQTPSFSLAEISVLKAWFMSYCNERYADLVPECSNVQFGFLPALPPQSKFVTISFDVAENGVVHSYQVNAALRGWAGNLLDDSDEIVLSDDD